MNSDDMLVVTKRKTPRLRIISHPEGSFYAVASATGPPRRGRASPAGTGARTGKRTPAGLDGPHLPTYH